MTVRRGFLYLGAFFVATGGVMLLASTGVPDRARVTEALTWWPVVLILIGTGLVLRRTVLAVPAGLLAAIAPGLLLGGMLVAVPDLSTPCTDPAGGGVSPATRQGSFGAQARVDLELSCGELAVTTAPGSAWSFDTRHDGSRVAEVTASAERLAITSGPEHVRFGWGSAGDDWTVVLPTDTLLDLDTTINAGRGRLDFSGARLDSLGVEINAGDVRLDLADATVNRLHVAVNAGAMTVLLPATGGFTGDLEVNAGSLDVCVPPTLGLRVTSSAALGSVDINGLIRRDNAWVTPGYETAQSRADLAVSANVGSVNINAQGECT